MKRKISYLFVLLTLIFIVITCTAPVFAQNYEAPDPEGRILEPQTRPKTHAYGLVDHSHIWIPAEAFFQRGGSSWEYIPGSGGYIRRDGGNRWFMTPVNLPSGVEINNIQLWCYDNFADENIRFWYMKINVDTNTMDQVLGGSTSGTPGYTRISFDPYMADPQLHVFDNYHIYNIYVDMSASTNNLQFRGVRISYSRRISAPPSVATFSDVSTTMQFFPYIEALAASGITTGYSDGTFRPNQAVTRGQMAAFLARALGLHHYEPIIPDE